MEAVEGEYEPLPPTSSQPNTQLPLETMKQCDTLNMFVFYTALFPHESRGARLCFLAFSSYYTIYFALYFGLVSRDMS